MEDSTIFLGPYSMSIGEKARTALIELPAEKQEMAFKQVRSFFIKGTKKLISYLPFENDFLESCRFVDPKNIQDSNFEKWVTTVARNFPQEISSSDMKLLEIESRLLQLNETNSFEWEKCAEQYPTLSRLARLVMIIPHGNAEVERVFSMLSDVITKKRKSLHPNTVRALCVCKSFISAHNYTASTFPVNDELVILAANAHSTYRKRVKEETALEAEKKREQKEKKMMEALKEEKENNPALKTLTSETEENDRKIKEAFKRKDSREKCRDETLKSLKNADADLQQLLHVDEKSKLAKKTSHESNKVFERLMKRKIRDSVDLDDDDDHFIPKKK